MRRKLLTTCRVAACLSLAIGASPAPQESPGTARDKVVLLELFTSQGCNMCPAAEDLIARLPELGVDPERVVPLAFHVDYFNDPWKDPFSDPQFSAREWQYSILYDKAQKVGKKEYLYFTPMLMVDGRYPMLGSDRAKAQKAIARALSGRPGVRIAVRPEPGKDARRQEIEVTLTQPIPEVANRDVLVGLAVYEEPVITKVSSGENAGKTLTEHFVVRHLAVQPTRIPRAGRSVLRFPVELDASWAAERCGLAVYAQDEKTGHIHQAVSVPWGHATPDAAPRR